MVLPVVEREMRVASRRRSTYRARMLAVGGMLAGFVFTEITFITQYQSAAQQGQVLFNVFAWLAFAFAALAGLTNTADCMSGEKREGTLGLLFLTDLKGFDVICGKLTANSVTVIYGLIATVPILSLPMIMGGVGIFQFIKVAMLLVTVLALSCAVGVFVSTHSRNERKALVFSILLMTTILFLPIFIGALLEDRQIMKEAGVLKILNFSPIFSMAMVMFGHRMLVGTFLQYHVWITLGWMWLLIGVLLSTAAHKAPLSWQQRELRPNARTRPALLRVQKWTPPRWVLDLNPYQWLALRGETTPRAVWCFVLALFAIWLVAMLKYGRLMFDQDVLEPTVYIANTFLKVWVVGEASRRFIEDKQNNAMELILSTPLNARDMARGQWRALVTLFAWPILAVTVWELVMLRSMRGYSEGLNWTRISPALYLAIDSAALAWIGMWYALKLKGRTRVIIASIALVLMIPTMVNLLSKELLPYWLRGVAPETIRQVNLWRAALVIVGTLSFNVVVIFWAKRRVQRNLRRLAIERFSAP
jgi:ABC-type transport system involved in cytochrome c biogenesis permease component